MTANNANRHGLSRKIPEDVRRQVRQSAGFGCVVCGMAICQYEHVDPEFADAEAHDPSAMAYLCAACHDKVTRRFWSKEKIKEAMKTPRCKQQGFAFGAFDIQGFPEVRIGHLIFKNTSVILEIEGTPLIHIAAPEVAGGPFRLSASFHAENGSELLRITNNDWYAFDSNWDVKVEGQLISIRHAHGIIPLMLRVDPPSGIVIEQLFMSHLGNEIRIEKRLNVSHIRFAGGQTIRLDGGATITFNSQRAGIVIKDNNVYFGG